MSPRRVCDNRYNRYTRHARYAGHAAGRTGGELDEDEAELRKVELASPVGDEGWEEAGVGDRAAGEAVRLTLRGEPVKWV